MAALTADAPQTYAGGKDEVDILEVLLGGTVFTGSILVKHATTAGAVKVHAAETTGFAGMSLGPGLSGERSSVREQGTWVGSINDTVAAADEGTVIYVPANSDNPADGTKTSTSNLPWGKIARVLTAGAAGVNRVAIYFQTDWRRSI